MSASPPWDTQRRRTAANDDSREKWLDLQKKTFTRWCNSYLAERGLSISDLYEDTSDGLLLLNLLEIIGKESVLSVCGRKYNKNPKMRIHRIENCNLIFEYVHARGLSTVNISSQDIVDANGKLILGLLFTIILRFAISEDGKQGLLLWCQKNTKGYAGVEVNNFHRSWADGKAFCALIHHFRPDLLDWNSVTDDASANLERAFAAAEQAGITRLLDVDDIAGSPKPDEKSLIAQLTLYWTAFASLAQKETLVDAIKKAVGIRRKHDEWISDFEDTAPKLKRWIEEKIALYSATPDAAKETAHIKDCLDALFTYRREEKPARKAELTRIEGLLTQIRTSESNHARAVYEPREEVDADHLSGAWQQLQATENAYETALLERYDALRTADFFVARFAGKADTITSFFKESIEVFSTDDVGDSLQKCQTLLDRFHSYEHQYGLYSGMLATCKELVRDISAMHVAQPECAARGAELERLDAECSATAATYKQKLDAQLEEERSLLQMVKEFNAEGAQIRFLIDELEEAVVEPYLSGSVQSVLDVTKKVREAKDRASAAEGQLKKLTDVGESLEAKGRDVPMNVNFHALNEDYHHMLEKIAAREQDLNRALVAERAKENAKQAFAKAAEELKEFMQATSSKTTAQDRLAKTKAAPQQIVQTLEGIKAEVDAKGKEMLAAAQEAADRQTSAGVFANTLTTETMPSLEAEFEELGRIIEQNLDVEKAAVAAAESDLQMNAEQAKEVRETFEFFDSNKSGALSMTEFIDGAQAIGLVVSQQDLESKYAQLTVNSPGALDFEGFASFMLEQLKHGSSKDDVVSAFKGLAGGSAAISEDTLKQNFAEDTLSWILERMPKNDQGLDYASFTEELFMR
eukprot:scaffold3537_cov256-Pinguiococcus_pyrenoidosus.AAC.10